MLTIITKTDFVNQIVPTPLNVITLGSNETVNIDPIITVSKSI
jgi:hypothetical protein